MGRVATRLIALAVSLAGSEEVEKALNCTPVDFRGFCAGLKEPTQAQFEALVDLIVREQNALIAKNRDVLAGIRAKMPKDV